MRVMAGNFSVRLELDPKAEITVQWHDLRWVREGDKVELTARYPAGRVGQAKAEQMTITAAKVLDAPVKAGKQRRKETQKKETQKKEEPQKKERPEAKSDDGKKVEKS